MTHEDWLRRISDLGKFSPAPGLSRMEALCRELGNPQKKSSFLHVAGTNGKGSVCAMLASVLQAAGYSVGLFTSPHLVRENERIRRNGKEISDAEMDELSETLFSALDRTGLEMTQFEFYTALCLLYFEKHPVDVLVLEVGLGGRLDATNIVERPLLSVITGIDFDHTAILGNTLSRIASEKAGIIKSGCPILFGGDSAEAETVIRTVATEKGAPYFLPDLPMRIRELSPRGISFDSSFGNDLFLSLAGVYQQGNLRTALKALDLLRERLPKITPEAVKNGLCSVRWAARFESFSKNPPVFCDGGHNEEGVRGAVNSIRTYYPNRKILILSGVMADKDYRRMAAELSEIAKKVFAVTPQNRRSLPAGEYAALFENAVAFDSVREGVFAAVEEAKRTDTPLLCIGSLYLYSEVAPILSEIL